MTPEGYVKLHRSLLDWEWFDDSDCVLLLVHLLLRVNWKEAKWRGETIPAGTGIISQVDFAAKLGWSRQKLQRTMDKLRSTGDLSTKPGSKWTAVTLENWAKYQNEEKKPGSNRAQTGQQPGSNRAATGQQPGTIEEGKKGRREEGKNGAEAPGAEAPTLFGNPIVNEAMDILKAANGGVLDGTVKANRRDAWTLVNRLAKQYPGTDPLRSLRRLVELAKADAFHGRNATNFRYLLDHTVKIIESSNRKPTTNGSRQQRSSVAHLAAEVAAGRFGHAAVPGTADPQEDGAAGDAEPAVPGHGL